MKKLIIFAASVLIAQSASAQLSEYGEELRKNMEIANAKMETLIADKECSSDNHCESVAYGKKACGGPSTYLIYSNATTDAGDVTTLAGEYTALSRAFNIETGAISDCMMVMPPQVACVDYTCQAI